jgi:superfamily II DNA/RNA helicase
VFTHYQSLYFAEWLTLAGRTESQVSKAMASARVDMNPHQVEAACFALKSPLAKGVLLADEVGLGKTIEASLVIAQKWAERKRAILLVVPASLRKQWSQELADKFELPSIVIDSEIARNLKKSGSSNVFSHNDRIVICSYEYAAKQHQLVEAVRWNLVVFDEAHRLRNLYKKDNNERAKKIHRATLHAESKILLSATPMQNNLMELFGLSKMIDEHLFGDEKSFKALYVNRQKDNEALADLKRRIKPLCHRTLRRQVQEEGGINFTNRYSLTQDFTPTDSEWQLYAEISEYLSRPQLHAIAPHARHLVAIGLHKILASSSFAVASTLEKMVDRLEKEQPIDEGALSDIEEADDWYDRFDEEAVPDASVSLLEEINLLKGFKKLADGITSNAKGEALITVLNKAFDFAKELGGARKAVVFTESCRTQQYLKQRLDENGFAGRLVLLNGSNSDAESRAIYREWLDRHAGSARISGSKSADMKAAIVEKFKSDDADILIATEAGGEGINLQFCSLLINYDLPWNPQKVEQRIGRIHRYGQLNDVVIVNFVNRRNPADRRVFELLDEKFRLFEGVFGASDEILGAIESNIDIEKRIYEIYQKCRTDAEIESAFNQLQEEMDEQLAVREGQAMQALLSNFDRDVVTTLKLRRDHSNEFLASYQQVLLDLARAELPNAEFGRNHFVYQDNRYDLSWEKALQNDSQFFRLQATEHFLAWDLIRRAKERKPEGATLPSGALTLHYDRLDGQYSNLKSWIGESGLLHVSKLIFDFADTIEEHLLVAACTEGGLMLDTDVAERLLHVPAEAGESLSMMNSAALEEAIAFVRTDKENDVEARLQVYFEQENEKLERWAEDRRRALHLTVDELDREIKELKRAARQLKALTEKLEAKRQIKLKERERDRAYSEYNEAKKQIEQQEDALLDEMENKIQLRQRIEPLFSVRWTLEH